LKDFFVTSTFLRLLIFSLLTLAFVHPVGAQGTHPSAVKILAPDGVSTRVLAEPREGAEIVDTALNGVIFETIGANDGWVEVRLPDKNRNGFVRKEHTIPWKTPDRQSSAVLLVVLLVVLVVAIAAGGALLWYRTKKNQEAARLTAEIPAAIKRAEEHFRSSDYSSAIREFKTYVSLQGGDVRNPDVYRRMAVCYQELGDIPAAVSCWEKMRALGGVRSTDDYSLGVELMMAMGQEGRAAQIYEEIVASGIEESKRFEIHRKLFDLYRKLKEHRKVVHHSLKLISLGTDVPEVVSDTVNYLLAEGQADIALEFGDKDLNQAICEELVEDKVKTPEAVRFYVKCLEYDRTDLRLHRLLADAYNQGNDYRKAISELIILSQLDRDRSEVYVEQAARIYMDNSRIQEAIAEGNPLVIKKIAQALLARSEVHSDAVAIYEKVLEFQPRLVGVNKILSTVYLTRGDLEKYMGKLRLLHEIDGEHHDYFNDLAQCVVDNNLAEVVMGEGNQELNARVLKQLLKRGAFDEASVAMFERLVEREPDNPLLHGVLAKAYEQTGDYSTSLKHLLALVQLRRNDHDLMDKAAKIAVRYNLLDHVLKLGTDTLVVSVAHELARESANDPMSRQVVEKALKKHPDDEALKAYLRTLGVSQPPKSEPAPVSFVAAPAAPKPAPVTPPPEREIPREPKPEKATPPKNQVRKEPPEPVKAPVAPPPPPEPEKQEPELPIQAEEVKQDEPEPTGASEAVEHAQSVCIAEPEFLEPEQALTTFVSAYNKPSKLCFTRDELFLPKTGGLAYKELDVVTEDGWGKIHVGAEVNTDRPVLMRIFRKDLFDPTVMVDFMQEVTALGFSLVHKNVLPIEDEVDGPGSAHGYVFPHYRHTLESAMRGKNAPAMDVRIQLVERVLDGVIYAHTHKGRDGVLRKTYHLQLQPSVIFLSEDFRECRISGFGYSQIYRNLTRGKWPRWQEPGMSPATMPPEFFRSKVGNIPERSSEIYSFGVLAYFILTGELPFEGPAFDDFKFQHTRIFAAPPKLISPEIPEWLEAIVLMCLEKDPEKRWGNFAEIQRAFEQGPSLTSRTRV
jgi:tetratricopeptide (TPR) repeat protein